MTRHLLLAAFLLSFAAHPVHAANPVVRFTTPKGSFDVELCNEPSAVCEAGVPSSVANFLGYVDRGDYAGSVIHRVATMENSGVDVIQGGGFRRDASGVIVPVPTQPAIANEFHQSNQRGTLAYARLGGQPDSATSQWFVNVHDNVVLDDIDGGFTVFGVVLGEGMEVVDEIFDLPQLDYWGFSELVCPLLPIFDPPGLIQAFRTTPVEEPFWTAVRDALEMEPICEHTPPVAEFANAMIGVEITRVPEPTAASGGLAAAAALLGLARRRSRARR